MKRAIILAFLFSVVFAGPASAASENDEGFKNELIAANVTALSLLQKADSPADREAVLQFIEGEIYDFETRFEEKTGLKSGMYLQTASSSDSSQIIDGEPAAQIAEAIELLSTTQAYLEQNFD